MWPYAVATLRTTLRTPAAGVLALIAVGVGWAGLELSVLALGDPTSQAASIAVSTGQAFGGLLALWVLARALDEDRRGGFPAAADQTAPGRTGRLLGRWTAATAAGAVVGALVQLALAALGGVTAHMDRLLITSILAVAGVAAWGLLLGQRGGGGLAVVGGLFAWFLGHLPWGTSALAPGFGGRLLAVALPGPIDLDEAWVRAGYTAPAVSGLLLVALALSPRPGSAE